MSVRRQSLKKLTIFSNVFGISLLLTIGMLLNGCGEDKSSATPAELPTSTHTQSPTVSNHTLTSTSAGGVQLGMTLDEALAALPNATSSTAMDGEGIEWIELAVADKTLMSVLLNEDHTISVIRVFSPEFATPEGVTVGESVQSAAAKLGGLVEIDFTEIESREFAKFKAMPDNIEFQVISKDGMAGIYPDGETITTTASPTATIGSIWIMED